ncbi:MAG: acetyl-CoA carboxylase biotin carboxyl carrier protein [Treponema sp.]|jgi:acetyl-CoA carboxylase biotin carboxyl carrier protein|nr:acetyl-CoA carboxylase biotin carboxyl carrier protein [Treponema sp.]
MNDESILKLMDKFSVSDMAELDIHEGALRIIFRKDAAVRAASAAPAVSAAAAPGNKTSGAQGADAVRLGLPGAVSGSAGAETITSPIVGTFYAAPGPDAPAYVRAGSKVTAGDTLCILEAMKMMNHLEAEFDCEILSAKAASGDLVEYNQVLFEVKRL